MSIGKALKEFRLGTSKAKTRKEAVAAAKAQKQELTAGDAANALARAKGAGDGAA